MFISRATCKSESYGITQVVICTDSESENKFKNDESDKVICAKTNRPIADAIMQAASKEVFPIDFSCNGVKYTLIRYSYNDEERVYNTYRKNHIVAKERIRQSTDIYVYSQRCRCVKCYSEYGFDNIINICGYIPLTENPKKMVSVDIQKCKFCRKYFVDAQSLAEYEKRYGKLKLIKHRITGNEYENERVSDWYFNPDSVLSRNGYSTKLNDCERKQILINMMEGGISKAEIKDKLSDFIYHRSERNPYASEIWRQDLWFVNRYELGSEAIVYFR